MPQPDPTSNGQPSGGAGVRPPFRQMELSRGVRDRRLARRVAKARLKLARETEKSIRKDTRSGLGVLRKGLEAVSAGLTITTKDGKVKKVAEAPDFRERRLSAEALLHHHREVVKIGQATEKDKPPAAPTINFNFGRPEVVEVGAQVVEPEQNGELTEGED